MKKTYWMNKDTGELLSYKEARSQFVECYDGDDETSLIAFTDIYRAIGFED